MQTLSVIGLFGGRVKDRAVLTDLQPQDRGPSWPCFPPLGRRLPGFWTVLQLQVPGQAQLYLPEGLHLLARFGWKTLDFGHHSVHTDQGMLNI